MAERNCTLRDYAMPNLEAVQGNINGLIINAGNFEIKLAMIQMIQKNDYFGVQ